MGLRSPPDWSSPLSDAPSSPRQPTADLEAAPGVLARNIASARAGSRTHLLAANQSGFDLFYGLIWPHWPRRLVEALINVESTCYSIW